jgi:hypothetical protein
MKAKVSHAELELRKRCRFVTDSLIGFVMSLIEPDHLLRPTARQALNHNWMKKDKLIF